MIYMSLADVVDRFTISCLKMERIDFNSFVEEVCLLWEEISNHTPLINPYIKALFKINSYMWDLESSIRRGQDHQLGLQEIGRRALLIRNTNRVRVSIKNKLSYKFGGFQDAKVNNAAEVPESERGIDPKNLWTYLEDKDLEVSWGGDIRDPSTQKILHQCLTWNGYKVVHYKYKTFYVHRLVGEGFLENPLNKRCIDHVDGVKTNNCGYNLRWCSIAENNSFPNKKVSDRGREINRFTCRENFLGPPKIFYSPIEGYITCHMCDLIKLYNLNSANLYSVCKGYRLVSGWWGLACNRDKIDKKYTKTKRFI